MERKMLLDPEIYILLFIFTEFIKKVLFIY